MRVQVKVDDRAVRTAMVNAGQAIPASTRTLLRDLAMELEGHALDLSRGGTKPGDYPIPVRTGKFRGAFGIEVQASYSVVYNEALYARALHDGFKPYGNPHAMPIRPRPYFTDALERLDVDAVLDRWQASLQ